MTTKHYTVSIIVSGEQGQVMRRDTKMPLAMYELLNDAIDLANAYATVADALAVGLITVPEVCSATGLSEPKAKKLLKAAGAKIVHRPANKIPAWGLPECEHI